MALPPPAPGAYVYLLGNNIIGDGIDAPDSVRQSLHWIGFATNEQKNLIMEDLFESFEDLKMYPLKTSKQLQDTF